MTAIILGLISDILTVYVNKNIHLFPKMLILITLTRNRHTLAVPNLICNHSPSIQRYPGCVFTESEVRFPIFLPPLRTVSAILHGEAMSTQVLRYDIKPAHFESSPSVEALEGGFNNIRAVRVHHVIL